MILFYFIPFTYLFILYKHQFNEHVVKANWNLILGLGYSWHSEGFRTLSCVPRSVLTGPLSTRSEKYQKTSGVAVCSRFGTKVSTVLFIYFSHKQHKCCIVAAWYKLILHLCNSIRIEHFSSLNSQHSKTRHCFLTVLISRTDTCRNPLNLH